MAIRSFLAFDLPGEFKDILSRITEKMKRLPLDVKWVNVENIHLTLLFLGYVKENQLRPIRKSAEDVCGRFAPFYVTLQGVGFFGSRRNPRVLWAGLDGEVDRMESFWKELQSALAPFGLKEEKRSFRPHLTLGRFRRSAMDTGKYIEQILSEYGDFRGPGRSLEELVLFKSDLEKSGPTYTKIDAWPLRGDL